MVRAYALICHIPYLIAERVLFGCCESLKSKLPVRNHEASVSDVDCGADKTAGLNIRFRAKNKASGVNDEKLAQCAEKRFVNDENITLITQQ